MKETNIDYLKSDDYISYYSSDPKYINRIRRQMAAHPDEVRIVVDDGITLGVRLPVAWFRPPSPPAKRKPMSEAQRMEARERMKKLVASKKQDSRD